MGSAGCQDEGYTLEFFWTHFAKDRIINCYWGGLLRRLFVAVVRDYHRVLSDKSSGNFDY